MSHPKQTAEERFWSHVDPCRTDGCALWLAGLNQEGYGQFWLDGRMMPAHHFLTGRPPAGLQSDHVKERGCIHRNCVWPEHLEAVTPLINTLRSDSLTAQNARKDRCNNGHALAGSNLMVRTRRDGRAYRRCRLCYIAYLREYGQTRGRSATRNEQYKAYRRRRKIAA